MNAELQRVSILFVLIDALLFFALPPMCVLWRFTSGAYVSAGELPLQGFKHFQALFKQ